LTVVVVLGVVSQFCNIVFLRVWSPFVDQHGSKVVLYLSSSLYFLVILGWTFATLPETHGLTIPLLTILHMLMGIASAGINISTTTLRMKMAPSVQATSYLTAVSLAASLGAGIGPLLGGAFADFFDVRYLKVAVEWMAPNHVIEFPAFFLSGYEFLFAIAFVLGVFTVGMLGRVREEGETEPKKVMDELMVQTRQNLRILNSVPGLSFVARFPVGSVKRFAPLPGLDVALGVSAHQLSLSVKMAEQTLSRGRETATQLSTRLTRTIGKAGGPQATAVALGAVRGAVHTTSESDIPGREKLAGEAVGATLQALKDTPADPLEVLTGAVSGAVIGADEAGLDPGSVAAQAVKEVKKAAGVLGLSEQEASRSAARATVAAAEHLGAETCSRVKAAVLEELITPVSDEEQE
jgi:MFS family permease